METLQKSKEENCQTSTYLLEDSLANLFQSLENEKDLMIPEEHYSLTLREYLKQRSLNLSCLKTLKDCYLTTREKLLRPSSKRLMNWGMMSNGVCITAQISVDRKVDRECILQGLFGEAKGVLNLAKGLSKKHRYCLSARRGLEIRFITGEKLAECPPELYEIMQGFPLGWTDGLPKTVRKFLLGNALTPDIPRAIIKNI